MKDNYYLLKKSNVDYYRDLFENFLKEHKEDEIGTGARDALFGIANILADAKEIETQQIIDFAEKYHAYLFKASRGARGSVLEMDAEQYFKEIYNQ